MASWIVRCLSTQGSNRQHGHLTAADPFGLSHVTPGKIIALLCVVEQILLGTDPGFMARRSWRPRAVLLKESASDTGL